MYALYKQLRRFALKMVAPMVGMMMIILGGDAISSTWIVPKCGEGVEYLAFTGMYSSIIFAWWALWLRYWRRKTGNVVVCTLLNVAYGICIVFTSICLLAVIGIMVGEST